MLQLIKRLAPLSQSKQHNIDYVTLAFLFCDYIIAFDKLQL